MLSYARLSVSTTRRSLFLYTVSSLSQYDISHQSPSSDDPKEERHKRVLHQPDLVSDELVDGICMVIPNAIRKIMENKWKEHIPLTLLTTAYLKAPESTKKIKAPIGLASDGVGVEVMTTANNGLVSPKDEAAMNFQEWLQAWNHLLELIDLYLPRATPAWELHWKMIWQHRERDTRWHCLMQYCIAVRKAAVKMNMNPGVWQAKIWQEIVDDDRDRIAAGRPIPGALPSQNGASTSRNKPSTSSHSSHQRANAPNAADHRSSRKPRGDADRDKCFRCGTFGHTVRECERDWQFNGSKIIIFKVDNRWTLDDKPFCYRFNTPKGCHQNPCPNPPHVCSLCGAKDHGAQTCRA